MYLSKLWIKNFRCFGDQGITIKFNRGLTALVGENDSGKTAILDAIRYALGTTDNAWIKIEDSDFFGENTTEEIVIKCKFRNLTRSEKAAFLEYLTYEQSDEILKPVLYLNWSAKRILASGREFVKTETMSGKNCNGPAFVQEARELLRATYLQPLRDAENALKAGKNSRLSQVLKKIPEIRKGKNTVQKGKENNLSIAGILEFADELLSKHVGIKAAKSRVDKEIDEKFALRGDNLNSKIEVASFALNNEKKLIAMLEKLTLNIERKNKNHGHLGLGTNNLLYMACELLLLTGSKCRNRMLLVEEPEAHIHAQRQLKIMKSLQKEAEENKIQIIVSTHSPLLASVIKLENMILVQNGKAFSLGKKETKLDECDYRFLERFLDATKANLFFAKGVLIVEGDAENILLPTIARILGFDLADYGISIVNVGGTGLRRYAKIFQRKDEKKGLIDIPVACITDLDVMPNCAPGICIKDDYLDSNNWPKKRKWKVKSDFDDEQLKKKIRLLKRKSSGQNIKTFITNKWTFEYDLAYSGLAEYVYIAAKLAVKDERNTPKSKSILEVYKDAKKSFNDIKKNKPTKLAAKVYRLFTRGTKASKAITAQYLAGLLSKNFSKKPKEFGELLPAYLVKALKFVTKSIASSKIPEPEVLQE